jgi:hypothetical protein
MFRVTWSLRTGPVGSMSAPGNIRNGRRASGSTIRTARTAIGLGTNSGLLDAVIQNAFGDGSILY